MQRFSVRLVLAAGLISSIWAFFQNAKDTKNHMSGSRNFSVGPRPDVQKQSGQRFFFSPPFILQFTEGSNYTLPRTQRGSNIFHGGGSIFSTGVQMLISIETHITCDFPGGGGGVRTGPPIPPFVSAHESDYEKYQHYQYFDNKVCQMCLNSV